MLKFVGPFDAPAGVSEGPMDKPTRMDEELWRAEAVGAVLGDNRWTCLTAGIAPDGSQFFALYRMRLTRTQRKVTLPCYRSRSFSERRTEIQHRLGIV
jgi:hypothetical protein